MNTERFEQFFSIYKEELICVYKENPDLYFWLDSEFENVAERMRVAIKAGSYNKDSFAFRRTCSKLGIKHTYAAITAYLKGE